jgi:8-amino-7-oxononanoate synthase
MTTIAEVLSDDLDRLEHQGLRRQLKQVYGRYNGVSIIEEFELLTLGSNDYLGMSHHPSVVATFKKKQSGGVGSTGSRLTTGNIEIHEQLEAEIAIFKHTEAAILFSSGYAANVGTIPALVGQGDLIVSDAFNHASIIDGCRLSRADVRVFRHADVEHAKELLADRDRYRRVLLVTDGVFSMDGDLARLPELVQLREEYDTWLMVDDAHGTGVFGATGAGVAEHFGVIDKVDIHMGTLSKAVGVAGGFVAGSVILIEWLRNSARSFMFSTAPPPGVCEAALASLKVIRSSPDMRKTLLESADLFRSELTNIGLNIMPGVSPIIPWIVGDSADAVRLSDLLFERMLWIPAIRPPTVPNGTARLRLTVTVDINAESISWADRHIREVVQILNPSAAGMR